MTEIEPWMGERVMFSVRGTKWWRLGTRLPCRNGMVLVWPFGAKSPLVADWKEFEFGKVPSDD